MWTSIADRVLGWNQVLKTKDPERGVVVHAFNPSTQEGRDRRISEFEASLVYKVSSRTARAKDFGSLMGFFRPSSLQEGVFQRQRCHNPRVRLCQRERKGDRKKENVLRIYRESLEMLITCIV